MKINHRVRVGPLLVERISDTCWLVRSPVGIWHAVSEDASEFGYLGESFAVAAVLEAEMGTDYELTGVRS